MTKPKSFPRRRLKPLVPFDVQMVQSRLDGLLINVDRDLQRQSKQAAAAKDFDLVRQLVLMLVMIKVASNGYAAICYLTVDQGAPHWRKTFTLAIAPINRQLMDMLFTIVYMRDDFPARTLAYERASYRAFKEEYKQFYGAYKDVKEWKPFFSDQKLLLRIMGPILNLSLADKRNVERIPRWKQPHKLSRQHTKSQPFLQWLHRWVYGDTSAEAHLSGTGLFAVSPFLLADLSDEQMKHAIESRAALQYHARHFGRTIMTVLAIATEIDAQFRLNNHAVCAYIWRIIIDHSPEAKDVYKQRYEAVLA